MYKVIDTKVENGVVIKIYEAGYAEGYGEQDETCITTNQQMVGSDET